MINYKYFVFIPGFEYISNGPAHIDKIKISAEANGKTIPIYNGLYNLLDYLQLIDTFYNLNLISSADTRKYPNTTSIIEKAETIPYSSRTTNCPYGYFKDNILDDNNKDKHHLSIYNYSTKPGNEEGIPKILSLDIDEHDGLCWIGLNEINTDIVFTITYYSFISNNYIIEAGKSNWENDITIDDCYVILDTQLVLYNPLNVTSKENIIIDYITPNKYTQYLDIDNQSDIFTAKCADTCIVIKDGKVCKWDDTSKKYVIDPSISKNITEIVKEDLVWVYPLRTHEFSKGERSLWNGYVGMVESGSNKGNLDNCNDMQYISGFTTSRLLKGDSSPGSIIAPVLGGNTHLLWGSGSKNLDENLADQKQYYSSIKSLNLNKTVKELNKCGIYKTNITQTRDGQDFYNDIGFGPLGACTIPVNKGYISFNPEYGIIGMYYAQKIDYLDHSTTRIHYPEDERFHGKIPQKEKLFGLLLTTNLDYKILNYNTNEKYLYKKDLCVNLVDLNTNNTFSIFSTNINILKEGVLTVSGSTFGTKTGIIDNLFTSFLDEAGLNLFSNKDITNLHMRLTCNSKLASGFFVPLMWFTINLDNSNLSFSYTSDYKVQPEFCFKQNDNIQGYYLNEKLINNNIIINHNYLCLDDSLNKTMIWLDDNILLLSPTEINPNYNNTFCNEKLFIRGSELKKYKNGINCDFTLHKGLYSFNANYFVPTYYSSSNYYDINKLDQNVYMELNLYLENSNIPITLTASTLSNSLHNTALYVNTLLHIVKFLLIFRIYENNNTLYENYAYIRNAGLYEVEMDSSVLGSILMANINTLIKDNNKVLFIVINNHQNDILHTILQSIIYPTAFTFYEYVGCFNQYYNFHWLPSSPYFKIKDYFTIDKTNVTKCKCDTVEANGQQIRE